MAWQAIVIVITLLTAASTIILASRAIREAVQTRAVFFADEKWAIDKHPAIASLVAVLWLSLIALVIFALAAVITDLPAVIKAILPDRLIVGKPARGDWFPMVVPSTPSIAP